MKKEMQNNKQTTNCRKSIVYKIPLACGFRYKCRQASVLSQILPIPNETKKKGQNLEESTYTLECANCFRIRDNCSVLEMWRGERKEL